MYYNNQLNRHSNNRKGGRGYTVKLARQLGIMLIIFLFLLLIKFADNETTTKVSSKLKEVFYNDFTEEATAVFESKLGGTISLTGGNNKEEEFYLEYLPLEGKVTKGFGDKMINPSTKKEELHKGIEIEAKDGAEIKAVFDGVVESIEQDTIKGSIVVINHGNNFKTVYEYVREMTLKEKETIIKGQILGKCSKSKGEKTNLFYFELRKNDVAEDPNKYMQALTK